MRVLITGSEGFLGQHIWRELAEHGHDVRGADIAHGPSEDMRSPGNVRAAISEHAPDVVLHLAAKVGRLFGEDDVAETIAENAGMTATVARACGEARVRLAYASTSEVYGDAGEAECCEDEDESRRIVLERAFAEQDATSSVPPPTAPGAFRRVALVGQHQPHNAYGLSKRWGEEACRLYAPLDLAILRFSMPFGPGLPAGRGRAAIVNMLWQAAHHEPIPVHRGAERSWCWVGDTARAVRTILESGCDGAWNVGRDDLRASMLEVAELACDITGAPYSLIAEVDAPARQTVVKRLSTERLRRLGWEPQVGLEEGMRRTYEALVLGPASRPGA